MKDLLLNTLCVIVVSFYFFPIEFRILPMVNTKMLLAFFGLCIMLYRRICTRNLNFPSRYVGVFVIGLIVSLCGCISTAVNNTNDTAYVKYFVSMSVWLAGAYSVLNLLRWRYGKIDIITVFRYLTVVCLLQCFCALLIDNIPMVKQVVDNTFAIDVEFFAEHKRLYGIGANTDTAGIRFSCVLLAMIYLMQENRSVKFINTYVFLFLLLVVIGNIMSRTTLVGVLLSLLYCFSICAIKPTVSYRTIKVIVWLSVVMLLIIITLTYLYEHNDDVYHYLRFGFEGFFTFFETGEWTTDTTKRIARGLDVFMPTEFRTYLVGDGLFADPLNPGAFYKGVDTGYIRLIYYFGLPGLLSFASLFIYCTFICVRRDPYHRVFYVCMVALQFIVWMKISTDIFLFYALILQLRDDEINVSTKY